MIQGKKGQVEGQVRIRIGCDRIRIGWDRIEIGQGRKGWVNIWAVGCGIEQGRGGGEGRRGEVGRGGGGGVT